MLNIYDAIPALPIGEESFETVIENSSVKIERICSNSVRNGEWYDQENDEWVLLVEGSAVIEFEDTIIPLCRGESLWIEKRRRHRVKETSDDALWLALHINS